MKRLLLISNIPASYRVDLYNLLATTDQIDCYFLFISEKDTSHKKIIWGSNDNHFYKKSVFIGNKISFYKFLLIAKHILLIRPQNIVIGGIPAYYLVVFLMKLFLNFKIFCWWAGNKFTEPKNKLKFLYRIISAKSISGCFFYSDYSKDYFLKNIKNLKPTQFKVIGNNTRVPQIYSKNKDATKKNFIFRITTIGFQEKRKNTILLLKSLTKLCLNNIFIEVIGDGVELMKLKKFALEHNLTNVSFLGKIAPDEVLRQISISSLLIHTSLSDSWPQVINEAAINRIPYLISTRSGVSNAYTKKFFEIVCFNPENENDLAKKIQHLIDNPDLLNYLGDYAQKDAMANNGKKVFMNFIEFFR